MIGRVGELRDQKVPRPLLFTAVDRRVEVDEMPAWIARRLQRDLDIALAVEGAGIADIAVVEDDSVDVDIVQPTPFKCKVNGVPAGPRPTSIGNAVGLIQKLPVCFSAPLSTKSVCAPPRSSGTAKLNSTRPDGSARASA